VSNYIARFFQVVINIQNLTFAMAFGPVNVVYESIWDYYGD